MYATRVVRQSNRIRSLVLTARGSVSVHGIKENGKRAYSLVIRFLLLEGKSRSEIITRLDIICIFKLFYFNFVRQKSV